MDNEPVTPICTKKRDRPISSEECDFKIATKISELRKQNQKQKFSKKGKFDADDEIEMIVVNELEEQIQNQQKNLKYNNITKNSSNPLNANTDFLSSP